MEDQCTDDPIQRLIGSANEARVEIEDIGCMALLDTGSQVTTLSESFYTKHFSSIPVKDFGLSSVSKVLVVRIFHIEAILLQV